MEFWNELTLTEQLSNIDGEVNRLIRAKERFLAKKTKDDSSDKLKSSWLGRKGYREGRAYGKLRISEKH